MLPVLDLLEDDDTRRLAWGLVDESWTEVDLLDRLTEVRPDSDPRQLLAALVANRFVLEVPSTWPVRYRTRMAEAVRLFARLRQLFPRKPWQSSPRLVADFRFRHEPRRFPRRDLAASSALEALTSLPSVQPSHLDALAKILGDRSLSNFQLEATKMIFESLDARSDRGVVVGAGTGSGKTLAFYLPALAHLATRPAQPDSTGVVAIYPRNELLKDQFATALDEVRALRAAGGRALRIGAYFGPTPSGSQYPPDERSGWHRRSDGWVCPYLSCRESTPSGSVCGGPLVWRENDRRRGVDQLVCSKCQGLVRDDELALTRNGMQARPPDLVFTTTEMLTRALSDGWSMHVFGAGARVERAPALVLLDEVHTYEGVAGAQAAYLLRRWRKAVGRPLAFVGLSATLANAAGFFSSLCGLPEESVTEVVPQVDDLQERGREYQLVLRGDPASQTALLSTSIQALMLLRRVLDSSFDDQSVDAFGSRVFAFCDNLDLVNRLYRQLLDAEGLDPFGRPDPQRHLLAGLRMPAYAARYDADITDWPTRDLDGQQWWMVENLDFGDRHLTVARTSSQDAGVDSSADVVVATASLEVGFDDPRVGAVLQHKAPRDVAQFLQRRGRAGRTQTQRPWTVVVLSDYGRDRSAYQDYETLLDPSLPAKSLPLGNQSVRKMQAAMCLLDWTAERLRAATATRFTARKVYSDPMTPADVRVKVADLLRSVIDGGPARASLIAHVTRALQLTEDEATSVCWEQPRSLLLDVVPTAFRRLQSQWARYSDGAIEAQGEKWKRDSPLPEFIPSSLFADLCLPEVVIDPPEDYDRAADTAMPIAQALNELAPGRVTLRWAVTKVKGLWTEPASGVIALEDQLAPTGLVLGEVAAPDGVPVPLVRPTSMRPTVPDPAILPSSNGFLHWEFQAAPVAGAIDLVRPRYSPVNTVIDEIAAYLHSGRGALRTWRYALHATSDVARRSGRERTLASFSWGGSPAALGYEAVVDAVRVMVRLPELSDFDLTADERRLRQLRRDHFSDDLQLRLESLGYNPFIARWITELVISAAALAVQRGLSAGSLVGLDATRWRELADEVAQSVFLALDPTEEDEAPLREAIVEAVAHADVILSIDQSTQILEAPIDKSWEPWLRARFLQTVAAALQAAAQQLCPDFDVEDDCVVDVTVEDGRGLIYLSDAAVGGGGLIETLTSRLSDDPRRFDQLVIASLEPSDLEEADASLPRALRLLESDLNVAALAAAFRSSQGPRLDAWRALNGALVAGGVSPSHATISNLLSRVFRPGSSTESDELLRLCFERWNEFEQTAGFAFDQRTAAAALARETDVRASIGNAAPGGNADDVTWAQTVLLGLLWVRAEERRATSLRASNFFVRTPPATERTLVLDVLGSPTAAVDAAQAGWRTTLADRLVDLGRCRVVSSSDDRRVLRAALVDLQTQPLELGWILVHPKVEATTRADGDTVVEVSLEEAPQ